MPIKISGLSHVSICVRDVERSLAFYRDLLGLRVIYDQLQDTTSGGLPHVYKNRHRQRRIVHLAYGDGPSDPFLALSDHPGDPPDGEPVKLDEIGVTHLAFVVPDVESATRELLAKGVRTCGPADAFRQSSGRLRTVFFLDPDGILVQLDEGFAH